MPGRDFYKFVLVGCALLVGADRALAYVGPGADVAFISYAMTLLLWMLAAFSAILLWPVYAFLRWLRGPKNESAAAPSLEEDARAVSHPDS